MNRGCLLSFESLCDRARAHLSFAPALIGRDAIDGGFDIVERADPIESFLSNLGAVGDVHVFQYRRPAAVSDCPDRKASVSLIFPAFQKMTNCLHITGPVYREQSVISRCLSLLLPILQTQSQL